MPSNQQHHQASLAYLLLKNSLKLFAKPWMELTEEEHRAAHQEAEEEYQLQQLILQTEAAAAVIIAPSIPAEAMGLIRQRFPDPESFSKEMKAHGLNEGSLLRAITDELRVDDALNIIGQQAGEATPEETEAYYKDNQELFQTPETRAARQILITINDDFPDNTREKAWQRITQVQKELAAAPARFEELVHLYSECPSALRGGMVGELKAGKSFPVLDQALFALKEGEISAIIESHLGFHLILCEKITPTTTITYEEAAPRILQLLTRKRQQLAQRQWLAQLTKNTK